MLVVLPVEELAAELQGLFVAGEAVGEVGAVLERLELALGERVVIRDVRPAVRLGDPQRGQKLGHCLRAHRRATVAVDRQLVTGPSLLDDRLANQPLGGLRPAMPVEGRRGTPRLRQAVAVPTWAASSSIAFMAFSRCSRAARGESPGSRRVFFEPR